MTLLHIEAENLKGEPFAYDLSRAVAIVGPNFAGKTRIIDAIRLALLGYLPELGKTNRATWGLSSGSPMTIRGLLSCDEAKFVRSFYLDGSTIKDSLAPGNFIGFDQFQAHPMLNASLYFSMTERERTNFVFKVIELPKELTVEGIISRLERISFEEGHSEQIEKAKRDTIQRVRLLLDGTTNLSAAIGDTIDAFKTDYTEYNKRQKDTIGAVRVLSELKHREGEFVAVGKLDEQLADARKVLADLNQAEGALKERAEAAQQYAKTEARVDFGAANNEFDEEINKLNGLIWEAEDQLTDNPTLLDDEITKLSGKHRELANSRAFAASMLDNLREQETNFKALKECPTCGAKTKGWKTKVTASLRKSISEQTSKLRTLDINAKSLQEDLDTLIARNDAAHGIAMKNNRYRDSITKWTLELATVRRRQQNWNDTLAKVKAELASMSKPVAPTDDDLRLAKQSVAEAQITVASIQERIAAYERYKHDLKRAAEASIEHTEAKARLAVVKAVLAHMQEIKTEVVDTAFRSLLKIANAVAGSVLKTPLSFYDGEVGRWDGAKFIGHGTFSGTEQALTFVAIATALAQRSPLRLLIFDELGRLDTKRMFDVITLLFKAQNDGLIDQFILAGAINPDLLTNGNRNPASWGDLQIIVLD